MSYDTGLSAVMNITAAYSVGADVLFCPSLNLCLADGVTFCLGSVFIESGGPLVFIVRLQIFSQGDTGAFGIGNLTVLNDPAFDQWGPIMPSW